MFCKFVQNNSTLMDIKFNKNEDHNKLLLSTLKKRYAKVKLGGGQKVLKSITAKAK